MIAIIGSATSGSDDDKPKKVENSTNEANTNTSETNKEDEIVEEKTVFYVGETAELKGVQITMTNFEESTGKDYIIPTDGNVFVLAEFEIVNDTDSEINISSMLSFEAYADDYSLNYSLSASMMKDGQLDGTIASGKKMKGWIGWEVSEDYQNVEIHFVTDRLSEKFSSVKESIGEKFNRAYQMITEKWGKLSEWFEDNVKKPIADVFSALWESLKAPLFKVLNTLSDMIEGFINSLIKGINGIIKPFNSAAKRASEYLGKDWNEISIVQEVSLPKITGYSVGGFPEDGWFRASKGEYFGQFDDGTSYIANNNQIETGIAVGVKDAVREAISEMYPYLADIAQNTRETAEKEFNLRIGDRDIGRANERYISRRGFSFTG